MSSTAVVRPAMTPVGRRVRAYFAPINRATGTPAVFDPGLYGMFLLDAPPAPWMDMGWIDNFSRYSGTSTAPLRAGTTGAPQGQYRGALGAQVEFDFREWGKLQMALAGGSEHMNVLACQAGANPQPSGGTPVMAVAVLPGSTASQIVLGAGAVTAFAPGDLVAVDLDYQQQTGFVGSPIAAAYVANPADVNRDVNYVRRVTFNVGYVAQVGATALLLSQPLLGGVPPAGANAQKVIAFVDREGGSFFQEWSALFVMEADAGGRVCFHYPWLSPTTSVRASQSGSEAAKVFGREENVEVSKPISALALHAAFEAMPVVDGNDGQSAVCYRSYFPAAMGGMY
jgi:hypothetical protein